jgi:hypothetical protein
VGALPQKSVLHALYCSFYTLILSILRSILTFEAKPPGGEGGGEGAFAMLSSNPHPNPLPEG